MHSAGAVPASGAPVWGTHDTNARVPAGALLRIGGYAGLVAGLAFALHLAAIGEIAAVPTTDPGIRSSTWTAWTGIATYAWGNDALHGSFWPGYIALGLAIHLAMAVVVGLVGVWWIYWCLGTARSPWLAIGLGVAYGTLVEVVAMQIVVNPTQSPDVVYHALPPWAWWAGHWLYGGLFGLLVSRRLEKRG